MANKTLRTITVAELIEELEGQDPTALVVFSCDYGDHHHTEQAIGIKGNCENVTLTESAYSNSGFAISEDEDEDDDIYVVIR